MTVSGFEWLSTCYLFQTRRYKVVSPSDSATRIRTYDQSPGAACIDQQVGQKSTAEMKRKSNYFKMDQQQWRMTSRSGTVITWDMFKLYLVRNYFCFSIYFLFRSGVMFAVVWAFGMLYG